MATSPPGRRPSKGRARRDSRRRASNTWTQENEEEFVSLSPTNSLYKMAQGLAMNQELLIILNHCLGRRPTQTGGATVLLGKSLAGGFILGIRRILIRRIPYCIAAALVAAVSGHAVAASIDLGRIF